MTHQVHIVSLAGLNPMGQIELASKGGALCFRADNIMPEEGFTNLASVIWCGVKNAFKGATDANVASEKFGVQINPGAHIIIAQEMIDYLGKDLAYVAITHEEGHLNGGFKAMQLNIAAEYIADEYAARKHGPEKMIAVLEKIYTPEWQEILIGDMHELFTTTTVDSEKNEKLAVQYQRIARLKKTFKVADHFTWKKLIFWCTTGISVFCNGVKTGFKAELKSRLEVKPKA